MQTQTQGSELIKTELRHEGPYSRGGDYYTSWKIITGLTKAETLKHCFAELMGGRLPDLKEYRRELSPDGRHYGDTAYKQRGYYSLEKTAFGFWLEVCEPFRS